MKRRKLGKTQRRVLDFLTEQGWWSESAGWVWGGPRGTERYLKSLVRAGYVTAAREGGRGLVYRPKPTASIKIKMFLSDGGVVDGSNPLAMLERQYRILMRLSRQYKGDERVQKAISDANMLGLEVTDRLKEAEEESR